MINSRNLIYTNILDLTECNVDSTKLTVLKQRLLAEYDEDTDSLCFFNLGNKYQNKVSHYGSNSVVNLDEPVIF